MDYTKARKLTLNEFVDVQRAIEKALYHVKKRIAEQNDSMEKVEDKNLHAFHKNLHASYVVEATELNALLCTVKENGPALWEYEPEAKSHA
jgi:hypothetical protein